jgi:hypothetical protein
MNSTVRTVRECPRQTVKEFLENASCGDAFAVREHNAKNGNLVCYLVIKSLNGTKQVCEARGRTLFDAETLTGFRDYQAYPAEVEMTFTVNIG